MIVKKHDIEGRIINFSLEIKYLVEEHKINRSIVIEDFVDLINSEMEHEDENC